MHCIGSLSRGKWDAQQANCIKSRLTGNAITDDFQVSSQAVQCVKAKRRDCFTRWAAFLSFRPPNLRHP